jgi:hypothetical protein
MRIVRVSYWTGEVPDRVVLLRDPYTKGPFMYGVHCNEVGVAHREGCYGAEYAVKITSITSFEEIKT